MPSAIIVSQDPAHVVLGLALHHRDAHGGRRQHRHDVQAVVREPLAVALVAAVHRNGDGGGRAPGVDAGVAVGPGFSRDSLLRRQDAQTRARSSPAAPREPARCGPDGGSGQQRRAADHQADEAPTISSRARRAAPVGLADVGPVLALLARQGGLMPQRSSPRREAPVRGRGGGGSRERPPRTRRQPERPPTARRARPGSSR